MKYKLLKVDVVKELTTTRDSKLGSEITTIGETNE
jgi:hypothetical protein